MLDADEFAMAEQIVRLIRERDRNGMMIVGDGEALATVVQAMRATYARGARDGAREMGEIITKTFDSIGKRKQ